MLKKIDYILSKSIFPIGFSKKTIVMLLIVSISYVILIAFWTHGKLLFGGDDTGIYNYSDIFSSLSISNLLWALSLFLSGRNIYATYYLHLFIDTLLAESTIYLLAILLFNKLEQREKQIVGLLAALFFLYNPWSVSLTYLSLVGDVGFEVTGFNLFLIGFLLFWNRESSRTIKKISPILAGIGLGIAQSPFPNYIRLLVVVFGIFLLALILIFMGHQIRKCRTVLSLAFFSVLTLSISVLLTIEYFLPIASNISSYVSVAASGAADHAYLGFYTGGFNALYNELRGLSGWQYPGIFYYTLYEKLNLLSVISYAWPILVLLLPLIFIINFHKRYSLRIIILELLVIAVIFWDKGANPPFGGVWTYINSLLPTGYQFIPTGYLTGLFINRLYPILAAFSILSIYNIIERYCEGKKNSTKENKKLVPTRILKYSKPSRVISIILVIILVGSAYPAFVGYAETFSYNGSNQGHQGFFIPESYYKVRNYLIDNGNGTSTLLLPGTTSNPYITTTWGYSGEIGFYSDFFAPASIITLNNYGGTYSNLTGWNFYFGLIHPFENLTNISVSRLQNYTSSLFHIGIGFLLLDKSIKSGYGENLTYASTLLKALEDANLAKSVYVSTHISLLKLMKLNVTTNNIVVGNFDNIAGKYPHTSLMVHNLKAPLYQDAGFADAGNIVEFSVLGYNSKSTPECYENGTYLGESDNCNFTFSQAGVYTAEAKLPNGTELRMNYIVNKKMTIFIAIPHVVIAGKTVYVSGAVFVGTTFPKTSYNWEWYTNGVYQKNIRDPSYVISIDFRDAEQYNLTPIVHDGLGEVASTTVEVYALNPTVYSIENGLKDNITPGSVFYFFLLILLGIDIYRYVRLNKRKRK